MKDANNISGKLVMLACILFLILAGAVGCSEKSEAPPEKTVPAPQEKALHRSNVLFVTMDTTREDHFGCYGNDEIKTPNVDNFAKDAVVFDRCYAVSHSTAPSHTSMFMSLYLKDHKVLDNKTVIPDDDRKLAKVFKSNGYRTAAFVSAGHLGKVNGFDRGFDVMDSPPEGVRTADKTDADAIRWLKENYKDPFYVWVHFYDPHTLYEPPPPYDTMYKKVSDERKDFSTEWRSQDLKGYVEYFSQSQDPEYYRNKYKGEISFMDSQLGRLFDTLKNLGIYDDTIIVIVADHGENMGEHGLYFEHAGLYDTTIHVPMIMKLPGNKDAGRRSQMVSSVDIYPTLLELTGIRQPLPIRGVSLTGILDDPKGAAVRKEAFAGHYAYDNQIRKTTKDKIYIKTLKDSIFGKKGDVEIYDIKDKGQTHNLARKYPDLAADFSAEADKFLSDRYSIKSGKAVADKKQLEKLKSLGYVR